MIICVENVAFMSVYFLYVLHVEFQKISFFSTCKKLQHLQTDLSMKTRSRSS